MFVTPPQNWRAFLNETEAAHIAALDQRIIEARATDADATREREAIRRRATGRMRRARVVVK